MGLSYMAKYLRNPEDGDRATGDGVRGSCELLIINAGAELSSVLAIETSFQPLQLLNNYWIDIYYKTILGNGIFDMYWKEERKSIKGSKGIE